MHFTIDWTAFAILCFALPLIGLIKWRFIAKPQTPSLGFSHVQGFKTSTPNWRLRWLSLPKWLYQASLLSFLLAFLDPHFEATREAPQTPFHPGARTTIPTAGIAIYLVLDQSGSMAEQVLTRNASGGRLYVPKIDLLKQVTEQFIHDRSSDLIGLISFARVPKVLVPLTLDQSILIQKLQQLNVVKNPQDDGTAIGYAIFKATNLITATRHYAEELNKAGSTQYDIKSAIVVVVTDGMQDPSRLDKGNRLRTMELDEAAAYAKSQNVRLYVVNIDPAFGTEQYAPHRRQMQKITELTGGQFFLANEGQELQQIYANINALEKGHIPQTAIQAAKVRAFSFYPYLISFGLICFLSACLLDTLYFRTFP